MKCWFCPCRVENSNEIDGYQPDGCFYGDDYLDDYCYEDKDGDCCCDKTKEEIENDIEVVYLEDLMASVLELSGDIEDKFIRQFIYEAGITTPTYKTLVFDYLKSFNNKKEAHTRLLR